MFLFDFSTPLPIPEAFPGLPQSHFPQHNCQGKELPFLPSAHRTDLAQHPPGGTFRTRRVPGLERAARGQERHRPAAAASPGPGDTTGGIRAPPLPFLTPRWVTLPAESQAAPFTPCRGKTSDGGHARRLLGHDSPAPSEPSASCRQQPVPEAAHTPKRCPRCHHGKCSSASRNNRQHGAPRSSAMLTPPDVRNRLSRKAEEKPYVFLHA